MQTSGRLYLGTIAVAVLLLGLGLWSFEQRGSESRADLVITGRTPPYSFAPTVPKVNSTPPAESVLPATISSEPAGPPPPKEVVVHVAGAVKSPGVYHFSPDARADDALRRAGGAKPDANLDAINLAAKLEDGRQVYVPTKKEQQSGGAPEQTAQAVPTSASKPSATAAAKDRSSSHGNKLAPGQGTININTANAAQLQRLPGVGPAMAAKILEFRKTNGAFTAVDQLMDVSGIGAKKFAKMQPLVRLR